MTQPCVDHILILFITADHSQIVAERSLNKILLIQLFASAHPFAVEFHGDNADIHRMLHYRTLYMMRLGGCFPEDVGGENAFPVSDDVIADRVFFR